MNKLLLMLVVTVGALQSCATVVVARRFEMVLVPAGVFQMGDDNGGVFGDQRPVREVTLSAFLMMQTEVTQGLYEAVMGHNPSDEPYGTGDKMPVNRVSWYDALVFANRLSMQEGLTPVYSIAGNSDPSLWDAKGVPTFGNNAWDEAMMDLSADGYRLPTEAEWEYAARGATISRNTAYAGGSEPMEVAWHFGNSNGRVHPVAQKNPNELGLYDMSGNVFEWCWDWFALYPNTAQTDPAGPASGEGRAVRGGSWSAGMANARVVHRYNRSPEFRSNSIGFRLVRRPYE